MLVTKTSDAEKRVLREMSLIAVEARALRILAWVTRFINNCRKTTSASATITADEIMKQEIVLVKQTQERAVSDMKFQEEKDQLG